MDIQPQLFEQKPQTIFSDCGLYRWRLERRWGPGRSVLCIMLNPSLAGSAKRTDNTTEKCIRLWKYWGFDAHVAMNICPFVSPHPKIMRQHMNGLTKKAREEIYKVNAAMIFKEAEHAGLIVAAWGRCHEPNLAGQIAAFINRDIYCLGTNQDGSPRHPLSRGRNHVPVDQEPILWRRGSAA